MTEEQERRLRSVAANIVDLEARVEMLSAANTAANTAALSHEEKQKLCGDLLVARANLLAAQVEATRIHYGIR